MDGVHAGAALDPHSYSQVYTEPFWADKLTLSEEKR